jgi:GPH family glycoside/pentoside/hexuronide:cation symporter
MSALLLIPASMFPDVIERDELETGMRREGVYYSFFVFFQKMALAGALAISGFILGGSGYVSPEVAGCTYVVTVLSLFFPPLTSLYSSPVQPDSVRLALAIMIGPVPCGMLLITLIGLYFYPITKGNNLSCVSLFGSHLMMQRLDREPLAHPQAVGRATQAKGVGHH